MDPNAGSPNTRNHPDPAIEHGLHKPSRRGAFVALGLTMLLWGSHGALQTSLLHGGQRLPWPETMSINIFLGTAFLGIFCAVTGRFRGFRHYTPAHLIHTALAGALGVFVYYALLLYAFALVDKDHAVQFQVLNYLFPVMTVLCSAWLVRGERLTVWRVLSMLVAFFGGCWVITHGLQSPLEFTAWRGVAAATGAAATYGLFSALAKRWHHEPILALFIAFVTSAAACVALLAIAPRLGFTLLMPRPAQWLSLVYLGVGSNCLGTVFWFRAIRGGDTAVMGSLVYLTLFVSVGFFFAILHVTVPMSTFIGSVFVVLGAVLASLPARTRRLSA